MKQKTCISWWEKKIRKRGIILAKQFASMESVIPLSLFGSVIAGVFQITFRIKMHANDVFLFFKNHF